MGETSRPFNMLYMNCMASLVRRMEEITPSPSLQKLREGWKDNVCKELASFAQEGEFFLKMQPFIHSLTYQALKALSTWNTT